MIKYSCWLPLVFMLACANSQQRVIPIPHYDISAGQIFQLPGQLREISGISFALPTSKMIMAIQDEEGKVYYFTPGDQSVAHTPFGPKGDYEDIAVSDGWVFILRSDGTLYSFALQDALGGNIARVNSWKDLLPKGEYEGLFADPETQLLYVLCKHCKADQKEKSAGGSILSIQPGGRPVPKGYFQLNVHEIAKLSGEKKISFHPSALTRNQPSNEWFILSSVNSMLVVADTNWQVKSVYPLPKSVFNQPEGIAFDSARNLYISNEGGSGKGNIIKFIYKP